MVSLAKPSFTRFSSLKKRGKQGKGGKMETSKRQIDIEEEPFLVNGFSSGDFTVKFQAGNYRNPASRSLTSSSRKITILKICIPTRIGIAMPTLKILEEQVWTQEILGLVISLLKDQAKQMPVFSHLANMLAEIFSQPKSLRLGDGRFLLGSLICKYGRDEQQFSHWALKIMGMVSDAPDQAPVAEVLFTVGNLVDNWSPIPHHPSIKKNRAVWCKGLESLVIPCLRQIWAFADAAIVQQLDKVIAKVENESEWARFCREVNSLLISIPFDRQQDLRIAQAVELISQVASQENAA
jgi:hypothetical protein